VAYVRTVKTSSGATAVQIVWSSRRGSRSIEHFGSAHDEAGHPEHSADAQARAADRCRLSRASRRCCCAISRQFGSVARRYGNGFVWGSTKAAELIGA
jgi:hypothetical protein